MSPSVPDLSCRELVELVTEYLEGTLPIDERTRLELHLATCDGCQTYLRQLRQVLETAGALTEEAMTPEARSVLRAAFRASLTR